MDDYQREHVDAYRMVQDHWISLEILARSALKATLSDYLVFRKDVDGFLETHLKDLCTSACYQSRLSACCTREGIIVFFADVAINCMMSEKAQIESLIDLLHQPNSSFKCIYLTKNGCAWQMKPIVCQMFLCDRAEREILKNNPDLKRRWEHLKIFKKSFTWPDRRVLFDDLEQYFIDAGMDSPLMYFHKSPGLLRIKYRSDSGK